MEKEMELQLPPKQHDVAKKLNGSIISVLGSDKLIGFEKAYMVSNAVGELKKLLTAEYMKPIMDLQGNRLGFKTDKDIAQGGGKGPGYPEDVVKNCLIEAVLTGVQPTGNQFNIIAGNCYITKEGFGYMLANIKGLAYEITFDLPRINADKTSAAITAKIKWTINGETKDRQMDIPVKMNAYMGSDAVIGKATRKARAWLYNTINGTEIAEGDVMDTDATVVSSKTKAPEVTLEDIEFLFESKSNLLTEQERVDIGRIILNKEASSYNKIYNFLQKK